MKRVKYLLLAKEISDLNRLVAVADACVDGKMGINEPHFVAVALGDAGDKILHVAQGGANGGGCFPRTKPRVDFQLSFTVFVSNELKIEIQMLEVSHQFSAGALNFDDLGMNFDAHAVRDVHGLGGKNRLHFCNSRNLGYCPSHDPLNSQLQNPNSRLYITIGLGSYLTAHVHIPLTLYFYL